MNLGLFVHFMGLAHLTLKHYNNNIKHQKIPLFVAKIAHHICGSKRTPNYEIQVENYDKQQTLTISYTYTLSTLIGERRNWELVCRDVHCKHKYCKTLEKSVGENDAQT